MSEAKAQASAKSGDLNKSFLGFNFILSAASSLSRIEAV